MRRQLLGLTIGTVVLCAASMIGSGGAQGATLHSTQITVARPVTAAGHPAPGYSVVKGSGSVDCSFPESSPSAVSKDILFCSPSAARALACWRAAAPHHVLCLTSARVHRLVRYLADGKIAHTTPRRVAAPLDLMLFNGTVCSLRDGGAGATLKQHRNWGATYYCTGNQALWAPLSSKSLGVNRAHKVWTVQVADESGAKPVRTAYVAHAWRVGTHA